MAFTLVQDIFAKVDGAITSMVSANVATIISDVTPLVATCLTIKLMMQGLYSMFNPGAGDSLSSLIKEYLSIALILSFATAGGWFQQDLVNVALHMPDDFAGILSSPDKVEASGVPAIIDSGIEKGVRIVNTAWDAADVFSSSGLYRICHWRNYVGCYRCAGWPRCGLCDHGENPSCRYALFRPDCHFLPAVGANKKHLRALAWIGNQLRAGRCRAGSRVWFHHADVRQPSVLDELRCGLFIYHWLYTALLLTIISIFVLFQIPQVAQSWGSGISAGVADAARSTGSSMQALGNMGSHGMFGGNAFRGGNTGGGTSNRQVEEVAATAEEAVVLI